MPIFPCGVVVTDSEIPLRQSLYAFNVLAANRDEAEGKAARIIRRCHPKKTFLIKVNSEGRPLDPETATFAPE